jgi:hypothetical protein
MKTLAILILLCASSYGADITTTNITADITTKTFERRDGDGKSSLHIETVYRGKTKVLMIMSQRNKQGVMTVTRNYLVGGKSVLAESDEDGDGFFESVMVFDPATDDFEMFIRKPDGSVKPISTQTLEATKKQTAVVDESLRKLFQKPDMSDKELSNLLEENRQKIESIEKEKKDDKK